MFSATGLPDIRQRVKRLLILMTEAEKKTVRGTVSPAKGFAQDMPRMYGYAPRGQRCFGKHDWHAKGRVNALGALLAGVLLTVGLTTSNVDTAIFNLWLSGDLLPKLPPGSVVVMDNAFAGSFRPVAFTCSLHKRTDTQEMIENAGHSLEVLPPYSPDLNPIEPKWAQAKAIRRRTGQTPDQIFTQTF